MFKTKAAQNTFIDRASHRYKPPQKGTPFQVRGLYQYVGVGVMRDQTLKLINASHFVTLFKMVEFISLFLLLQRNKKVKVRGESERGGVTNK